MADRRQNQRGSILPLHTLELGLDTDIHPGSPSSQGHIQTAPRWQCQPVPLFSGLGYGIANLIQDHRRYGPSLCFQARDAENPLLKVGLSREDDVGMGSGGLKASQ